MGVDAATSRTAWSRRLAITNFDNEMIGLYKPSAARRLRGCGDQRRRWRRRRERRSASAVVFADLDLDGSSDLVVANGHIDETVRNIHGNVGYAQPPHLFLNDGSGTFRDVAAAAGEAFARRKSDAVWPMAISIGDGDVDLLMTTNGGPALLFRNDQLAGNRSVRCAARPARNPIATPSARRSGSFTAARFSRGWSRAVRAICRNPSCR